MVRSRSLIIFLMTIISAGLFPFTSAGGYELPKPAPMPTLAPTVPEGESQFYALERALIPGWRIWSMGCKGDMWVYGTSQSVGDGAGMIVYVPAGGEVNAMCAYDTSVRADPKIPSRTNTTGLCLWFKGDGSDATAIIATDYAGAGPQFKIPMKNTEWHKVFIPWEKWGIPAGGFWFINFRMERSDKTRPNWYIVDRIHLYKEEKTEEIKPTPDNDPPGLIPAKAFISGQESIKKTLAKLKRKKPVKIVVAGDSIAAGAQLWYAGDKADKRIYWHVLGERLGEFYGYTNIAYITRSLDAQKQWKETPPARPAADLNFVGIVQGGMCADFGFANIDQILAEKPDLVIWEYGANDATFGAPAKYAAGTSNAVVRLKAEGVEVILHTVTPTPGVIPVNWMANKSHSERVADVNKETRRIAAEQKVALADMEGAFICRGMVFVGSLYADGVHLNHLGHEMVADVLDALLTDRDVRVWTRGPAADKAKAGKK